MNKEYIDIGLAEDKLIEECSEVIKAICKAKRFGLNEIIPGTSITNQTRIQEEIADLKYAIETFEKELQ